MGMWVKVLPGGLPRMSWSAPRIMTAQAKKKRRVIVIGDSLLRGTEGPIMPTRPIPQGSLPPPWGPG